MLNFRSTTFANVTSVLALVVATGGVSYAAVQLPRNSVGSAQIKTGAVKKADLAKNSVTSKKVKDGSLLAGDFAAGQLPAGPAGPAGPVGPAGPRGLAGLGGPPGEPGSTIGYASVTSAGAVVANQSTAGVTAARSSISGIYCIDPPLATRSVMVSPTTDAGIADRIVTARLSAGEASIGGCSGRVLVFTYDVSVGGYADTPFNIWFED